MGYVSQHNKTLPTYLNTILYCSPFFAPNRSKTSIVDQRPILSTNHIESVTAEIILCQKHQLKEYRDSKYDLFDRLKTINLPDLDI